MSDCVARADAAYALPLSLLALLPFGEFGGSLATALVWAYVGLQLLDRR